MVEQVDGDGALFYSFFFIGGCAVTARLFTSACLFSLKRLLSLACFSLHRRIFYAGMFLYFGAFVSFCAFRTVLTPLSDFCRLFCLQETFADLCYVHNALTSCRCFAPLYRHIVILCCWVVVVFVCERATFLTCQNVFVSLFQLQYLFSLICIFFFCHYCNYALI